MDAQVRAQLLDAYFRRVRRPSDSDFWAWEKFHDEVQKGSSTAWTLIVEAVERGLDKAEEDYFAAGPVEELINWHGPKFIDLIETHANKDPRIKNILFFVWLDRNHCDTEVFDRFKKIVGPDWTGDVTGASDEK